MSKKGWTTVTLGDIAENISVRVDDPSKSGLDRFVGLVHLDSGSVTVSRWDSSESVTSTMKRFQAGDVLLARRNAHLRRASAVDFQGVCSGDAYVLREKPDAIVPGLLKYILNTNRFWEYAIANADGSMSTRVKWKHIMDYRVGLQSTDNQIQSINILEASTKLIQAYENIFISSVSSLKRLGTFSLKENDCSHSLGEFCEINPKNLSKQQLQSNDKWKYIDLSSISFPNEFSTLSEISLDNAPSRARRIVKFGDLLVSTVRPNLMGHGVIEFNHVNVVASTGYCVLRPYNTSLRHLLLAILYSNQFLSHVNSKAKGSNYPAITNNDVMEFKIPNLSNDVFESISKIATELCHNILKIRCQIPVLDAIRSNLLEKLL